MADPVTMMLVGGSIMQGLSSIQQGRLAEAQGAAQEKIDRYNAKQLERQGKARLEAAKIESSRISRNQKIIDAANRARAAKSGMSLSESPSTIEFLADQAFQFHLDRNFVLNQGMQDYIGAQNQASLLRAEGAFAKDQGKLAEKWGYVGGLGNMTTALYVGSRNTNLKGDQKLIKSQGGLSGNYIQSNANQWMSN